MTNQEVARKKSPKMVWAPPSRNGRPRPKDDDCSGGQYQGIADQTALACDEAAQGKGGEDRNYQWWKAPHPVGVFDDTEGGVETEGQQYESGRLL